MPATVTFTRYVDVVKVLGDDRFQVPPMPPPGPDIDLRWLRATVSRFSSGETHSRRRGLCRNELDGMPPEMLRIEAARLAEILPPEEVAVEVLAGALGLNIRVYEPVARAAAGYLPGMDAGPRGDEAVRRLVGVFGGKPDEVTAAKIALLVQACNATAALIANAVKAWHDWQPQPVEPGPLVAETLRFDPPVPVMRRVCVALARIGNALVTVGDQIVLDIRAANRDPDVFTRPDVFDPSRGDSHLTFGAGVRPCPGRDHAFAIATGVVETLMSKERA